MNKGTGITSPTNGQNKKAPQVGAKNYAHMNVRAETLKKGGTGERAMISPCKRRSKKNPPTPLWERGGCLVRRMVTSNDCNRIRFIV